jgi:hypothetical protein
MKLTDLLEVLKNQQDRSIEIVLPTGQTVPAHFHVTEVGCVQKRFVDCGGTLRSHASCVLQVWVANDIEHRLDTSKLAKILDKGLGLFDNLQVPLEIEYEQGVLSQYPVERIEIAERGVVLQLSHKHTACLAPDRCRIDLNVLSSCSGPGCC